MDLKLNYFRQDFIRILASTAYIAPCFQARETTAKYYLIICVSIDDKL